MTLEELRRELDKLPPEADEWPVQILFWSDWDLIYKNEDVSHISADDYVVIFVGESAK